MRRRHREGRLLFVIARAAEQPAAIHVALSAAVLSDCCGGDGVAAMKPTHD
mgnify:CR=1 FL=1